MNNKVVIIGCGNVGEAYAYALLNQRTYVNELVLIDINKERVDGDVMDLNHCLAFAPSKMKIRSGDYSDTKGARIVCIAAGVNQKPGESRLELLEKNKKIMKDIVKNVIASGFDGIFLVATNPVDIMTHTIFKASKFPQNRVFGSGTSLDTARLRYLIGEKVEINPKNVHAYVIGEHGDSEFVPWSSATIGLKSIDNYLNEKEKENIYEEVRDSAYKIIEKKGFTNFGIGVCLVRITNAILGDENTMITISCYDKIHDIFISKPVVLGKDGIKNIVELDLNQKEKKLFQHSINTLKKM